MWQVFVLIIVYRAFDRILPQTVSINWTLMRILHRVHHRIIKKLRSFTADFCDNCTFLIVFLFLDKFYQLWFILITVLFLFLLLLNISALFYQYTVLMKVFCSSSLRLGYILQLVLDKLWLTHFLLCIDCLQSIVVQNCWLND